MMSSESFDLAPAKRRVLMDDAVDALRDAILSGKIPPGARLIEEDLATSLQVSRGPIRQALFRLQGEGLVVHEPHRGASVRQVTEEDIADIYSLRTALERLAIEQASRRGRPEELAAIEGVLAVFGATPRTEMTRQRVARLDIDFHDAIFRAARSPQLYRAWETLRSQLMMFLLLRDALPDDYLDSWHRDHLRLLDAIRGHDADAAMRLVETHIGNARDRLLASLRASGHLATAP